MTDAPAKKAKRTVPAFKRAELRLMGKFLEAEALEKVKARQS